MPLFRKTPKINSRIVSVVGMHRSGTSCLAGSLQQKGLHLGEVAVENEHNKKGNRENALIASLNESILAHSGGSWYDPPPALKWTRKHARERDGIISGFESGDWPVWGFKEPRALLTMPFWLEVMPDMEFVGTYRHPYLVAKSLERRDSMPTEYAVNLWKTYNGKLLELYESRNFPVVSFDLDQEQYLSLIDLIATQLKLPNADSGEVFLEQSLKNTLADIPAGAVDDAALRLHARLDQISLGL